MFRHLARTGLRKGLLEGSRTWLTIGVIAGGVRLLRRMTRNDPEVLMCEELPDGAVLVISNKGPRNGRQ